MVGKNPSPIIAKLLQDLPWMCQNYKRGCREIKITISGLEFHQRQCIFRKVYCPELDCYTESLEIELLFKDVTKHLDDDHNDSHEMSMIEGETNIWLTELSDEKRNFEERDLSSFWSVGKMTSTCGAVFFLEAWLNENAIHCWVGFLGSPDDAKNYTANFNVYNKSVDYRESYSYSGPVHTLDKDHTDILEEEGCFFIKLNAVRRCLNKESKCLDIIISIKNVKGEDHGESDAPEEKTTINKRRRR